MNNKKLNTIEDFENLKKGDFLAVEWNRNAYYKNKYCRFAVYEIFENKKDTKEIILQKKNNVYFNYEMYLNPKIGISNAENVTLIYSDRKTV